MLNVNLGVRRLAEQQITIREFSGKIDFLFSHLKHDQDLISELANSKDAVGSSLTKRNVLSTLGKDPSNLYSLEKAKRMNADAYGFWLDLARLFGFGPTLKELHASAAQIEFDFESTAGIFSKNALQVLDAWMETSGPRQRVYQKFAGIVEEDGTSEIIRGDTADEFKHQFLADQVDLDFQALEFSFCRHKEAAKDFLLGLSGSEPESQGLGSEKPFILTEGHFSARSDTPHRATEYLRGQAPTFDVVASASVPRKGVSDAADRINGTAHAIAVHAPTADGLTTFLMQVARVLVGQDTPVYWAHGGKWKPSDAVVTSPHILIVDDIHLMREIPGALLNTYGHGPNKVIFGVRKYRLHELRSKSRSFLADFPIPPVVSEDAAAFTSLVSTYSAADDPNADLNKLFRDEIKRSPRHLGSLFPAMFAATRGELLEQRFNRILDELDTQYDKQLALAVLVYLNFKTMVRAQHYQTARRQAPISFLKVLAQEINKAIGQLPGDKISKAVDALRTDWEGELHAKLNGGLELRHERIADVLFRWLFGAATYRDGVPRGQERYNKWMFVLEEGRLAFTNQGVVGVVPADVCLNNAISTARYDIEHSVPLDSDEVIEVIQEINSLFQQATEGVFEAHLLNAYSSTEIAHLLDEVDERTQHYENALSGLQAALNLPKLNHKQISQIADVLSRNGLNDQKLEFDGDDYSWLGLKGRSISKATTDGDQGFAEFETFKTLNQLLKVKPSGKVKFGYPRFLAIADLFSSSHEAIANIHVEKRLEMMLRLHRWAFMQYKEDKEVPEGTFEGPVPDSRRAISKCLWRTVQSAHTANGLKRLIDKQMYKGLLNSAMKREVDHIAKFEGYSHPLSTKLSELEHFSKSGDAATFAVRFVEGL